MRKATVASKRWRYGCGLPVLLAIGTSLLAALSAPVASAQAYPTRPIKLIVPFPPGGATDTVARLLGQKLTDKWGQQLIVDNRPGGNTVIGAELAAKSAPDGYTLFLPIDFTLTMNQTLYPSLPYDPVKSFTPVSLLTAQSLQLSASPKLPIRSLKELVDYAKANPGKINCGTGALTSQVAGELFKAVAGIEMANVPFKGSPPVLQALLAGDIDLAISDIPTYVSHIKAGRLRGLATTGRNRTQALPDVPTVAESGYPGFEVQYWFGLVAPAATPKSIIDKLNVDVNTVLALPEIKTRLAEFGLEPSPSTPEQFAALIKADIDKWSKVIRAAKIRLD